MRRRRPPSIDLEAQAPAHRRVRYRDIAGGLPYSVPFFVETVLKTPALLGPIVAGISTLAGKRIKAAFTPGKKEFVPPKSKVHSDKKLKDDKTNKSKKVKNKKMVYRRKRYRSRSRARSSSMRKRGKRTKRVKFRSRSRGKRRYVVAKPALTWNSGRLFDSGSVEQASYNRCKYKTFSIATHTDISLLASYVKMRTMSLIAGAETATDIDIAATEFENSGLTKCYIKDYKKVVRLKNNNNVGIHMIAYWFVCKKMCEGDPVELLVEDQVNRGQTNSAPTIDEDVMLYPNSSGLVNKHYRLAHSRKIKLEPGEEKQFKFMPAKKFITYDTQNDNNSATNMDNIPGQTVFLVLRSEGSISHDTVTDELVGVGVHSYDYTSQRTWKQAFPPSNQLKHIFTSRSFDTITAGEHINAEAPNDMEGDDVTQ